MVPALSARCALMLGRALWSSCTELQTSAGGHMQRLATDSAMETSKPSLGVAPVGEKSCLELAS